MTTDDLSAEFSRASGTYALTELIACLHEVHSREPAFAAAACTDAVLAMEILLKGHTDADAACIETACSTFAAALFNSSTDYRVNIHYADKEVPKPTQTT
jgi:hypothetical protein